MQIKNSEQNKADTDIHGRIESLDQNLRSVDHRLRAVEKRLSIKMPQPESDKGHFVMEAEGKDTSYEIEELRSSLEVLSRSINEIKNEGEKFRESCTNSIEAKVMDAGNRITKLENLNKITIGNLKVPIEFSGLMAAIVLLATGYFISADRWDIIRSSYYPVSVGILFAAVVILKFIMTNRK